MREKHLVFVALGGNEHPAGFIVFYLEGAGGTIPVLYIRPVFNDLKKAPMNCANLDLRDPGADVGYHAT